MVEQKLTVDVIIPTYHPTPGFERLLASIRSQSYQVRDVIVVNTGREFWEKHGFDQMVNRYKLTLSHIAKEEFDHGGTRAKAAASSDADVLLFLTQDAMPQDDVLVENLMAAFDDPMVAAAYGRQLPAPDCKEIERYTRSFNYPDADRKKSRADIETLGIKTFFCSNVCAAYRREIYERLNGFICHTIFNEDMIFAGKAVKMGYTIAYQSKAIVIHSHNYSAMEYLRRNFDLGVSQADNPEIFQGVPSESEGMKLVKQTATHLIKTGKPWLIFSLFWVSGFKFAGYKLGKGYQSLPHWMIGKLTMNRAYWDFL